jgi:hypothetical protein
MTVQSMTVQSMTVQFNSRIPETLRDRVKVTFIKRGERRDDVIARLLTEYLKNDTKKN